MSSSFGFGRGVVAAAVIALCGVAAQAGTLTVTTDSVGSDAYSGSGTGTGGEYMITSITGLSPANMGANVRIAPGVFQTFCLEIDETSGSGDYTVSLAAVDGGRGGPSPDPISDETAWLFTQFWKGTLSDYNYLPLGTGAGKRVESANSLQRAIWWFEQELNSTQLANLGDAQANTWIADAQAAVANGWTNGNVRVLNVSITDRQGVVTNLQDYLVIVPLPPSVAMGLGLMGGLGAIGFIRRRRRQNV